MACKLQFLLGSNRIGFGGPLYPIHIVLLFKLPLTAAMICWSRGAYSFVPWTVERCSVCLPNRASTRRSVMAVGLWAALAKLNCCLDSRMFPTPPTATVSFPSKLKLTRAIFQISFSRPTNTIKLCLYSPVVFLYPYSDFKVTFHQAASCNSATVFFLCLCLLRVIFLNHR